MAATEVLKLIMMVMTNIIVCCNIMVNSLSTTYYMRTCPMADLIVKNTVFTTLKSDPTLAASLLRMHFHDCFIQGCDGSILIDSTKDNVAEKDSPANLSLRGYEVIDAAKEKLENFCPGVVSCADILAMAARDAVFFVGIHYYQSSTSAELYIASVFLLGMARCSSFKTRLSNFDSTPELDPSIDAEFASTLAKTCSLGDKAEQPLDSTRNSFDNNYFNALQRKTGVLFSDQTLYASSGTRGIVNAYAMNQARFFFDFQRAMVKMGLLDVKEGDLGEVRANCHKTN